MPDFLILVVMVGAFLIGSLVISDMIWRRSKRDREHGADQDGDDLGGAV